MSSPVVPTNDVDVRRARALARFLDTAIGVPGTRFRIGADAILGLIPGGGDIIGAALSTYIILAAARKGVSPAVLWRMVANVAIDTAIGAVPLVGDLFDVAWKSNIRNVELLEQFVSEPQKATTRSRAFGILVVVIILLALSGLAALSVFVATAVWQLLTA